MNMLFRKSDALNRTTQVQWYFDRRPHSKHGTVSLYSTKRTQAVVSGLNIGFALASIYLRGTPLSSVRRDGPEPLSGADAS